MRDTSEKRPDPEADLQSRFSTAHRILFALIVSSDIRCQAEATPGPARCRATGQPRQSDEIRGPGLPPHRGRARGGAAICRNWRVDSGCFGLAGINCPGKPSGSPARGQAMALFSHM